MSESVQKRGRVNSGWRVDSGLLARIDEVVAARDMNRSRWLEEAALAHLERDPRVARDLARVVAEMLVALYVGDSGLVSRAEAALAEYERVTRV